MISQLNGTERSSITAYGCGGVHAVVPLSGVQYTKISYPFEPNAGDEG